MEHMKNLDDINKIQIFDMLHQKDDAPSESEIGESGLTKDEYEEIRFFTEGIRQIHLSKVKEELVQLENQIKGNSGNPKTRSVQIRWIWGAAASIILLIFTLWYFDRKDLSGPRLFSEYNLLLPDELSLRSQNGIGDSLKVALAFYNSGNFDDAIEKFLNIDSADPNYSKSRLYYASALLQLSKFAEARSSIENLKFNVLADSQYKNWLVAMSYLGENNLAGARPILEDLADSPSFLSVRATHILEEIKW